MKINPDIQTTIEYLHRQDFEDFRKEHKEAHTCEVGNGKKTKMPLNKAIGILADRQEVMHYEVKDIKAYTLILRDLTKWHTFNKKYKVYWIFSSLMTFIITHNFWQPILLKLLDK